MRQPACSGMLVVVLVGLGCSSPRVEDLAAEGSWELRSEGNVGDQQVTLRTTDGREERREVPAAEAGPLTLELKALPVWGVLRLGFITEKDVDAGTATLTAVDVDGAPVGWPGVFQARGGGFEGELVLSRELPRAPATASVLGEPGGVCAATRESGLAIRFDAVGSRAEVTQFARVSLDGGAGCAAALEAEAQGGGMLGAAVKQGILSASRASGLASFSTASRLTATRASTAAPAVSPLSERSIPRDVERSTPVKLRLPSTVGVGLPLAIDGHVSSTARDEDRLVTITVDPPSGPDVTLEAEASGMGRFSVTFAGTTTVGTYTITAEQRSTGTVTARDVEVVALAVAAAGADRAMEEVITVADEAVALVEDLVTALPPSPEKVEMTSRLSSFKAQVGQARTALPRITGAVERLYAPAARQPELARAVTPELQALARWADGAPRVTERWKSMLGRARMAPTICDQAEYAGEAFAALSTALNFATVARNIVKNLLVDKGLPKLVEATIPFFGPTADADRFLAVEAAKEGVAALDGVAGLLTSLPGLAIDLAQYASQQLMKAYCVRFEGPISAQYRERWTEKLEDWAKMTQFLAGKVVLRYQKGAPAAAIPVTGHIEGNSTYFDFWSDYTRVQDPRELGLVELVSFPIIPVGVPFDVAGTDPGFGAFARMLTPGYFHVPVQGELKDGVIALKLLPAAVDHDSALYKNTLAVILFEPITLIPQMFTFDFPVRKAATVLGLAMAEPYELPLTVNSAARTTTFARQGSSPGETDRGAGVFTRWTFSISGASRQE